MCSRGGFASIESGSDCRTENAMFRIRTKPRRAREAAAVLLDEPIAAGDRTRRRFPAGLNERTGWDPADAERAERAQPEVG